MTSGRRIGRLRLRRVDTAPKAGAIYGPSPVPWARWGLLSKLIAQGLRPSRPAVLVLSLPRSGSSWVGDVLGHSPDALYLREPVTQSDPVIYRKGTVVLPDDPEVRGSYRRLADRAFLGWPGFWDGVVSYPGQWGLRRRLGRRLVIKEVNPRATGFYLRRYRPRVIFLVRHPAAVALSYQKKGWLGANADDWARSGRDQGLVLSEALEALEPYPDRATVFYESLCADPLGCFRKMFAFTGLTWDDRVQQFIDEQMNHTRGMIDSWRGEAPREAVEALRRGYREFGLAWYGDDEDWSLSPVG